MQSHSRSKGFSLKAPLWWTLFASLALLAMRAAALAGEDRPEIAPSAVDALDPSAQRRLVHHIVVVERCQVGEFNDDRRRNNSGPSTIAIFRSEEHQ